MKDIVECFRDDSAYQLAVVEVDAKFCYKISTAKQCSDYMIDHVVPHFMRLSTFTMKEGNLTSVVTKHTNGD